MRATPPRSEAQLLDRAATLAGLTLGEVATRLGQSAPRDSRRGKGWGGTLVEAALGGSAGSRSAPDFELIAIELKTLPVDARGRPRESTYVCAVPLDRPEGITWQDSKVRLKLQRVLWVPLEAGPDIELAQRRIGNAVLWSPSCDEERRLRADWEEIMELVCLGEAWRISAHHGECLQVRPKAANAAARRLGVSEAGGRAPTLPRGFYLRSGFTESILRQHYFMPR